MQIGGFDHGAMGKKPQRRARTLHIGEWIARLGRKPVEVAKAAGIGESYLSTLISGERKNPSALILLDISDALGISVNALYRPPPPVTAVEAAQKLEPSELVALGSLLDKMKEPGRR